MILLCIFLFSVWLLSHDSSFTFSFIFNHNITSEQFIRIGQRLNITFPCDCVNSQFLAHVFSYITQPLDIYESIARVAYANLTTGDWVAKGTNYEPTRIPDRVKINVTVNCSCGDEEVSDDCGLFTTYPLRSGERLESVAAGFGLSCKERFLQKYNPGVNFSAGSGIVYVPTEDPNGSFRPLISRKGISKGALVGIILAGAFVMILVMGLLFFVQKRKKSKPATLPISSHFEDNSASTQSRGGGVSLDKSPALTPRAFAESFCFSLHK